MTQIWRLFIIINKNGTHEFFEMEQFTIESIVQDGLFVHNNWRRGGNNKTSPYFGQIHVLVEICF